MAGWHHWLEGREFEWTLGVGDGQGDLACCNSWGHKELDMPEQLNWTELMCQPFLRHCITDAFQLWCWRSSSESLNCKENKAVNPRGCQPWIFIGKTLAETEAPILWPLDMKSQLIGKDPDAGRDWVQEEKGTTEDEMEGWHHWLEGREFEWTLGVGVGQGGLACCNSWGRKESDTTEWLNWTELIVESLHCKAENTTIL